MFVPAVGSPRPGVHRLARSSRRRPTSGAPDTTTFLALADDSGDGRLSESITLSGQTVSPTWSYRGASASGSTWTAASGANLALASTGTAPTTGRLAPGTAGVSRSVAFTSTGQVYQAASSVEQLGDDDWAIEVIFRAAATATTLFATKGAGAASPGFSMQQGSGSTLGVSISDGTTLVTINDTGITPGAWGIYHCFRDKSDATSTGGRAFYNGAATGSVNWGTVTGPLNGGAFTIGSLADFTSKFTGEILSIRVYKRSGWFPGGAANTTAWAAWVKERAAYWMGLRASAALGNAVPVTMTRAAVGYADRVVDEATGERRLFLMGANAVRLCKRRERAGGEYMTGVAIEPQRTNLFVRSEEFDSASWTKTRTTVTANAIAAPTGDVVADGFVADTSPINDHSLNQTVTFAAGQATMSVFAKAGAQRYIGFFHTGLLNGVMFDLQSGVVGNRYAAATTVVGHIERFGDGWFRCSMTWTATAGAVSMAIQASNADWQANGTASHTFVGTGAVSLYLWGAQAEASNEPTTYVATSTATASRTADALEYVMSDGNFVAAQGQLSLDVMYPAAYDLAADHMLAMVSATSSTNPDHVSLSTVSNNQPRTTGGNASVSQWTIGGAGGVGGNASPDIVDGERHSVLASWKANDARLLVDGASAGTPDASVSMFATAPAVLNVGRWGGWVPVNALIGNVRIRNAAAA